MKYIFSFIFCLGCLTASAQMGIGTVTPNSSAQLDVTSTSKGLLVPRLTNTEMNSISSPVAGLQVYNTTKSCLYTYNGNAWTAEKRFVGKFVSAGTSISLDNIKIRIPSSGNVSIQLGTVSTSATISGSSINVWNNQVIASTGAQSWNESWTVQSVSFTTTFSYWQSGASFIKPGGFQIIYLMDETNAKAYKLTFIYGVNSSSHYLEIEQLL